MREGVGCTLSTGWLTPSAFAAPRGYSPASLTGRSEGRREARVQRRRQIRSRGAMKAGAIDRLSLYEDLRELAETIRSVPHSGHL